MGPGDLFEADLPMPQAPTPHAAVASEAWGAPSAPPPMRRLSSSII